MLSMDVVFEFWTHTSDNHLLSFPFWVLKIQKIHINLTKIAENNRVEMFRDVEKNKYTKQMAQKHTTYFILAFRIEILGLEQFFCFATVYFSQNMQV